MSEVQCGDEEEEGRSSQASEGPWSADDSRAPQACRVTLAIPTAAQGEAEAGSTEQTRAPRGAYQY